MKVNLAELEKIRQKHHLTLILLHGSQASGQTHTKSDIDLAVTQQSLNQSFDFLDLLANLNEVFPNHHIDLSNLSKADPLFLYAATHKAKLLAGKKKDFDSLQKIAFHKYQDYQPFLKMEADYVKERLKTYVTA